MNKDKGDKHPKQSGGDMQMNMFFLRMLFVVAMIVLCVWIISLSYSEWFRPAGSVLDKYTELTDEDRLKTASLDELVKKYDESYKKVKDYESNKANTVVPVEDRFTTEPYKSEIILKDEIQSRESDARQLHRVRYYWLCGLIIALLGLIIYRRFNELLGLPFMVAGFSEMINYTQPTRYSNDINSIITNQLILSFLTLILLIVFGYQLSIMKDEEDQDAQE